MVQTLKILVVGSCGKKKRSMSPQALGCKDIPSKKSLSDWRIKFPNLLHPVRDMYTGNQTKELVKGVDLLRDIKGVEVDFYILSAGFGLLRENAKVPPYECSFIGMCKREIIARSEALLVPKDFRKITKKPYDLAYLALGQKYLLALGEDWFEYVDYPTIVFGDQELGVCIIPIPANKETVIAFSKAGYKIHGIAGFKGDLFRILAFYAQDKKSPYKEVMKWRDGYYLLHLIYDIGNLGEPPNLIQTSITTGSK